MPHVVVAIPVRDEALLIGDCLRALALQQDAPNLAVVLLVNNSTDGTAEIVRGLAPALPCQVHVVEHEFAACEANAGHARRLAVAKACMLAEPRGIVMTTDADGCVAPDWVQTNLAALDAGADVVCGRAVIDPVDALLIPRHLHDDDDNEVHYATLLERIACMLDPDPHDPWPRHREESGASIAVRLEALTACGGVPPVRSGEDRALLDALRQVDARVRHEPDVEVVVSGRIVGRAADGMADTIRRRIRQQDPTLDSALEPVVDCVRRVSARRLMRAAWNEQARRPALLSHLSEELRLPVTKLEGWLALPYFGQAWSFVEAASQPLARRPVKRREVAEQASLAADVLATLSSVSLQLFPKL